MKSLTYVEIDLTYCANTYGSAPCTAAVGVTGALKCFNAPASCQDRVNFVDAPATLRFAVDTNYLPKDIDAIPSIKSVSFSPATISLGEDLGQRATLTIVLRDHRHSDAGAGFDKYVIERGYDPFTRGTFWGKFRARHPYVRGRPLRLIRGELGQALADMETRFYIIDSFNGPNTDGTYTLVAKDVLKLADDDRSQAPRLSNGSLLADINAAVALATLTPTGIGEAEYPVEGYIAIGGKEIVQFNRDAGIDAFTKFMGHFDGTDTSTTFTDSSASAHTVTPGGNAQLDTAAKKFGTASLLLDGTGDYALLDGSSDFAFGTGDFTVDLWVRRAAAGADQALYDSRPTATNGAYLLLYITAANKLTLYVNSAAQITGTTSIATGAFHHVAVTRKNGVTRLFLDGVQEGAEYADATSYLNGANRPALGIQGPDLLNIPLNGWMDEIRVSKGIARWTTGFVVPASAYSATSGDTLNMVRGQLGTTAATHTAQDRMQLVLRFVGEDPATIIQTLMQDYAGIAASWIPIADWLFETTTFLGHVYTASIAEPTGVRTLISELVQQAALAIWWDDKEEKIKLQVLRSIVSGADTFDEETIMQGSLKVREQPDKRLSQVWTYYGQRNPLDRQDNADNYQSTLAKVDEQAETDYGSAAIKRIYSRWIPQFGSTIAERVNNIILGRYKDPPRAFDFELFRGTKDILLGGGYEIGSTFLQDATGAQETAPFQVTRLNFAADRYQVSGEEALFTQYDTADLNDRVILVNANTLDFNLRDVHDSLFPEITDPTGITLTCIVASGVIVGSSSTATPAFDVGSWVSSLAITLRVEGRIEGTGGKGGNGSVSPAQPTSGLPGGTALYTRYPIDLDVDAGQIYGGGGGGGGNQETGGGVGSVGHGGSGGGGQLPGAGGASAGLIAGATGNPGTTEAGGAAKAGQVGGLGGAPGSAGSNGGHPGTAVGGAAGNAIDGISYITVTEGPGDRRGAEIN